MIKENKAYEIVQQVKLDELNAEGFLLKHKKTGARIALIPCEDNNKTFCVGFKTPPADDTGRRRNPARPASAFRPCRRYPAGACRSSPAPRGS